VHAVVTRYARSRDAQIAYQVRGSGPALVSLTGAQLEHVGRLQWQTPRAISVMTGGCLNGARPVR
jgi:hypothetical protein